MKKLAVVMLGVLLFTPAFANNWGLGLKLGAGQNDPKTMKDDHDALGGSLDKSGAYFGLEALYEFNLNDEANKLGVKVGWDYYGENKLKVAGEKVSEETYSFPFTAYYRRDNGVKAFSWFGGAGFTIISSKAKVDSYFGDDDTHKTKVFPHIMAGGEYRFTDLFALGLEARYNFSAKVKKNGAVLSDRSGFGAALTGRFYF